jgi:hypothetical protein
VNQELPAGRAEVLQLKGSAHIRGGCSRFFAETCFFDFETSGSTGAFRRSIEMRHQGEQQ